MSELKNIPTNIITGFLGSGKTTAINHLLKQKPEDEVWAILINELGQIGIDEAAVQTTSGSEVSGVATSELTGGCLCCALGPVLSTSLTRLLRKAKPDRLLIEPTGAGHPEGVLNTLLSDQFKDVLSIQRTICLIDPRVGLDENITAHPSFQQQLAQADLIVINQAEQANQDQLTACNALLAEETLAHIPRLETGAKQLELAMLNQPANLPAQLDHWQPPEVEKPTLTGMMFQPAPQQPFLRGGYSLGFHSGGWLFNPQDQFSYEALTALLTSLPEIQRIKGIFNTDQGWIFFNHSYGTESISQCEPRADSRLELISHQEQDWPSLQQQLLGCLKK